jgi:Gliding motility associated protein GldN
MNRSRIYLSALFVSLVFNLHAQTQPSGHEVWKKEVSRIITIPPPNSMFASDIAKAAVAGKLTGYSNFDHSFSYKLTQAELNSLFAERVDTVTVTGKNGKMVKKGTVHKFNPDIITRYRVLENWTYQPGTGEVKVQIQGIAPLVDILNEDGTFRGTQNFLWLKWTDVAPMLTQELKKEGVNSLLARWWNDFCHNVASYNKEALTSGKATGHGSRLMDISRQEDTTNYHLRDESPDSLFLEYTTTAVKAGAMQYYVPTDSTFSTIMSATDLDILLSGPADTINVSTPDGPKVMKVIHRDFNFEIASKAKVIEDYTFDPKAGTCDIQVRGLQAATDIYNDKGELAGQNVLFGLRYSDMMKALPRYDEYHPIGIDHKIWNSYFTAK